MLEYINDALCVSRFPRQENDLWACYKPSLECTDRKRQTWKRITTLLSTIEMQSYLHKHYEEESISETFVRISAN
ncbi:hypothetical protein [Neptuniibacter sp. QD57_21]|uniref:hypothetical protein n=1 Tax=Neptuniibacter sp. QD57_21 TaxID=3398213 RepID=UPI0039F4D8AA